jgi:hypothetical protein
MCEGLTMKAYKNLIIKSIIVIIAILLLTFIAAIYLVHKYDQNEKTQNETIKQAELQYKEAKKEKEKYEAEQRKKLQDEADQSLELQYQLIRQTVEENSDYYVSFSKEFLSVFNESAITETFDKNYSFGYLNFESKLENEFNTDLLGRASECNVINFTGITFVDLMYAEPMTGVNYYERDDNRDYYAYEFNVYCSVVYIPDEYMNEESINTLNTKIYSSTLENIKDNLFVAEIGLANNPESF